MAIPKGIQKLVWLHKEDEILKCKLYVNYENTETIIFKLYSSLLKGKGTLFSGTEFIVNKIKFFTIEDIYYYCGLFIPQSTSFTVKLKYIFELLSLYELNIKNIHFGLPLLSKNYKDLKEKIKNIKLYEIALHQFRCHSYIYNIETTDHKIFQVKADKQVDIYLLFENDEFHDCAHIRTYEQSVMMNSYFKSNDLLEESSENNLDLKINMICSYNQKFKKWEPIRKV